MTPPAWERHDFAVYAKGLVRVRRLERTWRVLLICAFVSILMPLAFALLDWPLPAIGPAVAFVCILAAMPFRSRAQRIQVRAIASWVAAGSRSCTREEPSR